MHLNVVFHKGKIISELILGSIVAVNNIGEGWSHAHSNMQKEKQLLFII